MSDDQKLIDVEWLKEVGFQQWPGDEFMSLSNGFYRMRVHHQSQRKSIDLCGDQSSFRIGYMDTTTRQMMLRTLRGLRFIN